MRDTRQRIADELDDAALHGTAAIGIAISRLLEGDVHGREQLIAAGRIGLQHRESTSSRRHR